MANCPTGSSHKDWIEYYINELGWSLIPVNEKKIPMLKDWNEKRNDPFSVDMALYWVEARGFGLGAITGDKLFYVVDDDYSKHPEAQKPHWHDQIGSTVVSRTQNGGRHYYFKPFQMANKQNIKMPDGDTLQIDLRGSNGQVLIPPFFGYSWEKPPIKDAYKALPTIKDLPPELIELFKKGRELNHSYVGSEDFFNVLNRSTHRDPILFERSFVLWQNHFKKPSVYSPDRIAAILDEFNSQFNPPKGADVVAKAFDQGRKYALSLARTEGELPPEEPELLELSKIENANQLSLKNYPSLKIGFPNFQEGIPSGMNLIIGTPGSGKSWFSIWLMRELYERHKQKSIFFSLEMDRNGLMKRILQSYGGYTLQEFENGANRTDAFDKCKQMDFIIADYTSLDTGAITPNQFVKDVHKFYKAGYRVFFFDHMHEVPGATVSNKSSESIEIWGDAFKLIRNTYDDVWLFILVQPNKEGYKKEVLTKENTSGSTSIINKCDFFMSLNRTEKPGEENTGNVKPIKVWIDKNRRGAMDRVIQTVNLDETGNFEPFSVDIIIEREKPEEEKCPF